MRSFAASLSVLALINVVLGAPTPVGIHSTALCRHSRGDHRPTRDHNRESLDPFGDDSCLHYAREEDGFDGRPAPEEHARLKSGDKPGSDAFDARLPDDPFHGDHDREDSSDELGSKESDAPHNKGTIAPRHYGKVETYADGEKFGDEPQRPEKDSHVSYRPSHLHDFHYPKGYAHNSYRPGGYSHHSHLPYESPHDTPTADPQFSQTQSNDPGLLGGITGANGGNPNGRNGANGFLGPIFAGLGPSTPPGAAPFGPNAAAPPGRNGVVPTNGGGNNGLNLMFGPFGPNRASPANEAAPANGNGPIPPANGNRPAPANGVVIPPPNQNGPGTP